MPKLSNRYSRFSFSDYKNQYTQLKKSHLREVNEEPDAFTEEPLSSIPEPPSGTQSRSLENPYNIEIWDIWNTKAEKYYYPNGQEEGQDSTQQVDSLQVMLAYEHEYTLFVARHPTYIQDMIPLDEREGAIFVIFSSFALYWKQFLAKVIALGILGQLKGKKLYIYTCYGWRKSKLMDVLAGQYGFKWRLCADMDKLGYSHPDILLACEYSNKVTLESLLKVSPTSLDRYKDVAQEESIPLQLKFVVAPCGAKDYKLFMASAWTLALKIFQSSSFENSSSPMNGNKSNKDFRLDLGRSSWFSKLYNLYVASKIDIDAQGNFFETNLE